MAAPPRGTGLRASLTFLNKLNRNKGRQFQHLTHKVNMDNAFLIYFYFILFF